MEKRVILSVIILTKNEASTIGAVLKRLSWADECIVVDNGSSDATVAEAKNAGAIVIVQPEKNFSLLRNTGAAKAKGEWLLYIDTDEEISESLREEIMTKIKNFTPESDPCAYILKRTNYYLGSFWPFEDGMIRLIHTVDLEEWYGKIHETARIKGTVGELTHRLVHRTHESFEDMVQKTNDWSDIEAKLRFDAEHPRIVPWRILRVLSTGFLNSYLKQKGYLAGITGVLESMYQAFSLAITYCKLWELQTHTV